MSGLLQAPPAPRACYVLAHGAGAGMTHPFLAQVAAGLAGCGVATLRYQFPYMERRAKRPDAPPACHATVRAAVAVAAAELPGAALFAGGKSFGGRMTSQAQGLAPLPGVRGLVFLGFPLHAPGKPGTERAKHLADVAVPMLFLQGTRDEFARLELLEPLLAQLGPRAQLETIADANHSFRVPAATGRGAGDIMAQLVDRVARWIDRQL